MKTVRIPPDLRRAISRFEREVRNHAWKGSNPPEEWEDIENHYLRAKDGLIRLIDKHLKEEVK